MENKVNFYAFCSSIVIHFFLLVFLGAFWHFPQEKSLEKTIEIQLLSQTPELPLQSLEKTRVEKKQIIPPPKLEQKKTVKQPKDVSRIQTNITQKKTQQTSSNGSSSGLKRLDNQVRSDMTLPKQGNSSQGQGGQSEELRKEEGIGKQEEEPARTVANVGDPGVTSPDYLYTTKPVYPAQARKEGLQGKVKLQVLIRENGQVDEIRIAKSSGYKLLDMEAIQAIQKWRFRPAKKDGQNVACWVEIPLSFKLQ